MRLAKTALLLFPMLLPMAAGAVDLNLGAEVVTGYDDNIFRARRHETDDAIFRLTPDIELQSQDLKLGWSLRYRPTYEIFVQHTDANELTHDVRGTFDYTLNDKTAIRLVERYRRLDVLNFPEDDGVDDEDTVVPDDDIRREAIDINDGSISLSHTFSPKWFGQTDASYRLFYTSRKNANDSKTVSGSQSFRYALNAANDVGFGGSVTVQMFDEFEFQPASNTFFYNLFGTWVRRFGESTTLSLRGGPALIHTDQDDINVVNGSAPLYPHIQLGQPETVGDLVNKYVFLSGELETGSPDPVSFQGDPVPAGSVLVPSFDACGSTYNAMADRCQPRYLIRESDPYATTIKDADPKALTLFGSGRGTDDYKVTFFGEVELTPRWTPTLVSTLLYNRSQGTASAQGSGTIADMVSLLTAWQPSELWDLSIRGTYVRRESANEISQEILGAVSPSGDPGYIELDGNLAYTSVANPIDTERWSVYARAARRVTRRTTLTLRLSYADQQTKRSSRNPDTFENFMALFGVRYDFDPIRF
jgi:hypothetical protein